MKRVTELLDGSFDGSTFYRSTHYNLINFFIFITNTSWRILEDGPEMVERICIFQITSSHEQSGGLIKSNRLKEIAWAIALPEIWNIHCDECVASVGDGSFIYRPWQIYGLKRRKIESATHPAHTSMLSVNLNQSRLYPALNIVVVACLPNAVQWMI